MLWFQLYMFSMQMPIVLDVRNDYEWDAGHFVGAERPQEEVFAETPVGEQQAEVPQPLKGLDPDTPVMVRRGRGAGWGGQGGEGRVGRAGWGGQGGEGREGKAGWGGQGGKGRLGRAGWGGQGGEGRLGRAEWGWQSGQGRLGMAGWGGQAVEGRVGKAGWGEQGVGKREQGVETTGTSELARSKPNSVEHDTPVMVGACR